MNTRPMPPSSVPITAVRISSIEELGVIPLRAPARYIASVMRIPAMAAVTQ